MSFPLLASWKLFAEDINSKMIANASHLASDWSDSDKSNKWSKRVSLTATITIPISFPSQLTLQCNWKASQFLSTNDSPGRPKDEQSPSSHARGGTAGVLIEFLSFLLSVWSEKAFHGTRVRSILELTIFWLDSASTSCWLAIKRNFRPSPNIWPSPRQSTANEKNSEHFFRPLSVRN